MLRYGLDKLCGIPPPRHRSPLGRSATLGSNVRLRRGNDLCTAVFAYPVLRGDLYCVPGRSQGRGVGQVELTEGIDGHRVEQGGGVGVDAFGDLRGQCPTSWAPSSAPVVASPVMRMLIGVAPG